MRVIGAILGTLGALMLILVVGFGLGMLNLESYEFFAPRYENARRQAFEQTRSFNAGMIQEFEDMRFQYQQADPTHRAALASIILHDAAGYNLDDPDMPSDLRWFIKTLRAQQDSGGDVAPPTPGHAFNS